jgi:hypothetical protein
MKILMPVIQHEGKNFKLDDPIVLGGVEMFQRLVYENIPGVIPVYISYEDRMNRKSFDIMRLAVNTHKPDLIFTNHFNHTYTVGFQQFDIPVVWLNHSPGIRSIYNVESVKAKAEFAANGGSIYFVSKDQHAKLNRISKRIVGDNILNVYGYINSAFATGDELCSPIRYSDAITVGRTDPTKNPFFIHKKLKDSSLNSCVITNSPLFESEAQQKYNQENLHWEEPRIVYRNLSHSETMNMLCQGKVYVSTCPVESWGITALEALTRGLPLILVTDSSGTHGSQSIVQHPSDYIMVPTNVKQKELEDAINSFKDLTYEQRLDISNRTKAKHSKANWIRSLNNMFADSVSRFSSNSLGGLFDD